MAGPIPDFGWSSARDAVDDPFKFFVENLFEQIKKYTGIDLFWMLDWSWTTNTIMELVRQANDLMAWLQNPIQRPPNLLSRPSFSSPSAIAAAPDWSWDAVVSLGTVTGPGGLPRTDPQGSARTTADGARHALMSNAISDPSAVSAGQILTCQINVLVEDGFTAADDQAIRLELVPSLKGVLQEAVVLAHCGVPAGDPSDWIAAPADAKAVFFDVDYEVPKTGDIPDTVELRLVVSESAGGDVPVRFDGARVAAAGGFLVVLADLFDAGRQYLTDMWAAIEAWVGGIFDQSAWTALKTDTDAAWLLFVKRVKRALRHADADSYVPPSTSGIISDALKQNPWFGWLFQLVDDWLEPILKIGKACADFGDACWQAVTVFVGNVTAPNAWQTMVSSIESAWDLWIRAVFVSWGATEGEADSKALAMPSPGDATAAALRNNSWFGWLFDMADDWLQPVLTIGKAVTDFGDSCWKAITTFSAHPSASGAWTTMVNAINSAWNTMVDAILAAWGSSKTHADFASPATAVETAIKNNPVTGWLWGNNFDGGNWLNNALAPITGFFDSIRKYINQMIEGLRWGYFDDNWLWVPSLTTPDTDLPGENENPVMTPGSNDGDDGGLAPGVDDSIPPAPKNVSAIPWWDITVSGFPAGNITYAIAAVKSGIEGPATQVKTFVSTLFPPNSSTHVDLRWDAVSGASSYRVYRKVDATYSATAWRLVASPSSAGTLLAPVVDKVARSGGTASAPKSDAELAAQIVTEVKGTAQSAQSTASSAASTAGAASSAASAAQSTANDALSGVADAQQQAAEASSAAALANVRAEAIPEGSIVISNIDPDDEDWGVEYLASGGATWKAPNNGGLQDDSVSWSQSIPAGAKMLFVLESFAGNRGTAPSAISLSSSALPAPSGVAAKGRPSAYPWTFDAYIGNSIANRGRGEVSAWAIRVPADWSGGPVTITSSFRDAAVIDTASVVVGGTASGDFDIITSVQGSRVAPADSLLVSFAAQFAQGATVPAPALFSGFSAARTTQDQACVQPYNLPAGAGHSMTYGEASRLATRNIDDQASITYPAVPTNSVNLLLVVKSVPNPGPTVGSFARIKTNTTTAPPVNSMAGYVLPLAGYYEILERNSPDITVNLSDCSFTVSYVGTYHVEFSVGVTKLSTLNSSYTPVVLVNGVVYSHGNSVPRRISSGATFNDGHPIVTHSCLVYATAGDVITFGVYSDRTDSSERPVVNRDNDRPKHAAISLVNRSYL